MGSSAPERYGVPVLDEGDTKKPAVSPGLLPMEQLSQLYETMCNQDVDDGSSNRREVRYLTADALMEKLRSLENRACQLKLEEEQVLRQAKELGFVDWKLVFELSGYRDPM